MASTSEELLGCCLRGERPPAKLVRAAAEDPEFFRIVTETLADRFEPALCGAYADVMAEAVAGVLPGADAAELAARYRRVRAPRPCRAEPARVVVLSRVTLGADVAVTSVILDAVKRRFPGAEIRLAGPRKNWELFSADPRIGHLPVAYPRGALRERLAAGEELRCALAGTGAVVVDTDSRLTQLGVLPVCPEPDYFFFESRGYGGESGEALPEVTRHWCAAVFGIADAAPYIAVPAPAASADIAVSLGVGENPAKRIADPFEERLLERLGATGASLCVDLGAGGEESARVRRAVAGLPSGQVRLWDGSFAGFASIISGSRLYAGYDSAGQHVAAACGVQLLCVFAGFPTPRMFQRWRPTGAGRMAIIRAENPNPAAVLAEVDRALR